MAVILIKATNVIHCAKLVRIQMDRQRNAQVVMLLTFLNSILAFWIATINGMLTLLAGYFISFIISLIWGLIFFNLKKIK